MKLTPIALVILTITAAALLACATPRERSEPQSQPEPAAERRPAPVADEQQQSELARLTSEAQQDALAATAPDHFRMSGAGDAEATHVLKIGPYQCGVTLQDNVDGGRPGSFRIQFMGPDPLSAPLVSWSEASWQTSVDFALLGREGSETGQVVIRVKAAPLGQWTLQCDRRAATVATTTRSTTVIHVGAVTESGETLPGQSALDGTGSSPGALILRAEFKYDCSINLERNVDETGVAAQFLLKIGDELVADVTAADWRGEYQYFREAGETEPAVSTAATTSKLGENSVGVDVTAGEYGDWSVVCTPKLR